MRARTHSHGCLVHGDFLLCLNGTTMVGNLLLSVAETGFVSQTGLSLSSFVLRTLEDESRRPPATSPTSSAAFAPATVGRDLRARRVMVPRHGRLSRIWKVVVCSASGPRATNSSSMNGFLAALPVV